MVFNPSEHLMKIGKGDQAKDYLPVAWRIAWFREKYPNGTIDTEEIEIDLDRETEEEGYAWNPETRRSEKVTKRAQGYARYRAVVTNGEGGRATGTKCEKAASFPDFAEKAETGAIGRALACLGFGTQFTGDEFAEGERLADAPIERGGRQQKTGLERANELAARQDQITKKREQARKMAEALGLRPPAIEKLDMAALDDLIAQYRREDKERRASQKAEAARREQLAAKEGQFSMTRKIAPLLCY